MCVCVCGSVSDTQAVCVSPNITKATRFLIPAWSYSSGNVVAVNTKVAVVLVKHVELRDIGCVLNNLVHPLACTNHLVAARQTRNPGVSLKRWEGNRL